MTSPSPLSKIRPGLRQEVLDWCVRRGNEGWSVADEAALQAWLQADDAHALAYAQWQAHWQALDAMPAEMQAQLRGQLERDKAQQRLQMRRWAAPAFAVAAVAAVMAVGGVLAWNQWQAQPVYARAVSTPRGQQAEVQLPDGSRLRLDSATRLEVTYYRRQRQIRLLDGQAVFNVQADAARPFRVQAGPVDVTVIGTRFSVRYTPGLPNAADVRVSVEHGTVHVAKRAASPSLESSEGINLTAGQRVRVDAQGSLASVTAVADEGIAPWRDNRISFVNTPLAQALAELERYASTGLAVRDPAVGALRLSGTFDPRDVQTLRRALPKALPVRLQGAAEPYEVVLAR